MLPSDIRTKMKRMVDEKLDSLEKYVPFIDYYLIKLEKEKDAKDMHTKFMNIKQWIVERKRHPMNVLEKIEACIITQYRNLFLVDGKVPKHIMDIFNTHAQSEAKCYQVNLCSDDEDNDDNASCVSIVDDDDDVIIVSTPTKSQKSNALKEKKSTVTETKKKDDKGEAATIETAATRKDKQEVSANKTAPVRIEATICIDSDDDGDTSTNDLNTTLNTTSEDSFYQEEKLFKRRGDFKNEEPDNVSLERQLAVVDKIDDLLNAEEDKGNDDDDVDEPIYIGTKTTEVPAQQQEEACAEETKKLTARRVSTTIERDNEQEANTKVPKKDVARRVSKTIDRDNEEEGSNQVPKQQKLVVEQTKTDAAAQALLEEEKRNGPQNGNIKNAEQTNEMQSNAQKEDKVIASSIVEINEENLERMDIEKLKKIYADLTKECPIDVRGLLKSLNLNLSNTPNENLPNNSLNNNNNSDMCQQKQPHQYSPQFEQHATHHIQTPYTQAQQQQQQHQPYPQLKTIELQRTYMPPADAAVPPIPPFKINMKDPRIRKYLEKTKNLPPIPPADAAVRPNFGTNFSKAPIVGAVTSPHFPTNSPNAGAITSPHFSTNSPNIGTVTSPHFSTNSPNVGAVTSPYFSTNSPNTGAGITKNFELPKNAPITYGEYRRLKSEQERKIVERKRAAEEAKRAEEVRKEEERRRIEQARKLEELKRIEEIKIAEEKRIAEEMKREEEARRVAEEARRTQDARVAEGARSAQDTKRAEEARRAVQARMTEEVRRAQETKNAQELRRAEQIAAEETKRAEMTQSGREGRISNATSLTSRRNSNENPCDTTLPNLKTIGEQLLEDERFLKFFERKQNTTTAYDTADDNSQNIRNLNKIICSYAEEDEKKTAPKTIENTGALNKTTTKIQEHLENNNRTLRDTQTDVQSILLRTILPYGDEILNIWRQNVADAKLSTTVKPQQCEAESTTSPLLDNYEQQRNAQNETATADVELSAKTTKNLKRQRKSTKGPKAKSRKFNRIRRISSSSSSSTLSDTVTPASPTSTAVAPLKQQPTLVYEPIIKLRRLSADTIRKYTARRAANTMSTLTPLSPSASSSSSYCSSATKDTKTINIQLVEDLRKTKKSTQHLIEAKPAKINVKYKNTNSRMTEKNTTLCVLCKSKPSDLTNHYKRVHKTESYVARLSTSLLRSLETQTRFAELLTKSVNSTFKKYALKCAFCEDNIEDKFINFYKHFATHTGEYAFQCGTCKLEKPFEFDIQSHKCHTKQCRNARIKLLYQYPPNVLVIYLYACKICNFVQLNEANTYKHLRDHHDKRQDDSNFIRKYILAAINDEELGDDDEQEGAANERPTSAESDNQCEFPKDDDDILVRNEALSEDMLQQQESNTRNTVNEELNTTSANANNANQQKLEACKSNLLNAIASAIKHTVPPALSSPLPSPNESHLQHTNSTDAATATCKPLPYIKSEYPDDDIAMELPRPIKQENSINNKMLLFNSTHKTYRQYPAGYFYFGLFKCMATDCLFCTDSRLAILQHLNEHRKSQCAPEGYLLCAYCQLDAEVCYTPEMLIEHIQRNHQHAHYQCSSCCYRALTPNHVAAHAQHMHPAQQEHMLVYKCAVDTDLDMSVPANILELLNDNVEPFVCPFKDCFHSFNSITWMQQHLIQTHNLHKKSEYFANLDNYACIYCMKKLRDIETVKMHLIEAHPDQRPYVCERILQQGREDDLLENLIVTYIPLPEVPSENIKEVAVKQELGMNNSDTTQATSGDTTHPYEPQELYAGSTTTTSSEADTMNPLEMKPNIEELLETAEECVKASLLKLTGNTGISPNLLYHCPQPTCGGFFSNYDLWYRHMSVRHCCIISECPHCPNDKKTELPLAEFKAHFEQHCRHLYGCFYCGETFTNEQAAREHVIREHNDESNANAFALQIEKVSLYFNHAFNVIMKAAEAAVEKKERYAFLLTLQDVIQKRCKYVEQLYYDTLKTQWIVPFTAEWLENVPCYNYKENAKRQCFLVNCKFVTYDNEAYYEHLRMSHSVGNQQFACHKCSFSVACENWEPIIDHIKMHIHNIHVCCVCEYYHYDRLKVYAHLQNEHRFRDVPLITIIRTHACVQISIAVVFAEMRKTFSTIKTCFICAQPSATWQTYARHLKKTHYITLQYFCELCNAAIQLTECDAHFMQQHTNNTPLRIRCQIATNNHITIDAIKPLQLQMQNTGAIEPPFVYQKLNADACNANSNLVKQEPIDHMDFVVNNETNAVDSDDDVEMISDDDIVIDNDALKLSREQEQQQQQPAKHAIRCVNVSNLQCQSSTVSETVMQQTAQQHMPLTAPQQLLISPTPHQQQLTVQQRMQLTAPQQLLISPTPQQQRLTAPQQMHQAAPQQMQLTAPQQMHQTAPQQKQLTAPQQMQRTAPQQQHLTAPHQLLISPTPQQQRLTAPQQMHQTEPQQMQLTAPQQKQRTTPQQQHLTAPQQLLISQPQQQQLISPEQLQISPLPPQQLLVTPPRPHYQQQQPAPSQLNINPQLLSPTSNCINSSTTNNSLLISPRVAIQSIDPNFTGTCHYRPVKIVIRPNNSASPLESLGNPPANVNYNYYNN